MNFNSNNIETMRLKLQQTLEQLNAARTTNHYKNN